jgi:hypothetical protein
MLLRRKQHLLVCIEWWICLSFVLWDNWNLKYKLRFSKFMKFCYVHHIEADFYWELAEQKGCWLNVGMENGAEHSNSAFLIVFAMYSYALTSEIVWIMVKSQAVYPMPSKGCHMWELCCLYAREIYCLKKVVPTNGFMKEMECGYWRRYEY